MFLAIEELSKNFESHLAVKPFDLCLDKGEFVTLLGPSGCGKTTVLKMIGGFVRPTQGRIFLDGIELTNKQPEERPLTTVFQNYALFPHLTVLENVAYGLRYQPGYEKRAALRQAAEMLEVVKLEDSAERNVAKLSGGQQQRVALARALVVRPKLLLLDEPLSNLDAKLREKIRKDIKAVQKSLGMTMLFVTHDQEEALSLSDRIVVMRQGGIEQIGTPKEIYENPVNEFVADFVGRTNIVTAGGKRLNLRPENLTPSFAAPEFYGRIVQKQYLGAYTTYFVQTENVLLEADIRSIDDEEWQIGEELGLSRLSPSSVKSLEAKCAKNKD